jgi:hypothetical protein
MLLSKYSFSQTRCVVPAMVIGFDRLTHTLGLRRQCPPVVQRYCWKLQLESSINAVSTGNATSLLPAHSSTDSVRLR